LAASGFQREPAAWRGLPAWRLAAARLHVVVCPSRGAKITSLFDAATGRQWLVPPPLDPLRPLTYGALWAAYEQCGWDEVCPTLGECAYPGPGRAAGRRLPDHGEVWALPWEDETAAADNDTADGAGAVVTSVRGAALPYRLTRRARLEGDSLILDYLLVNEGDDPIVIQWAAHPRLAPGDGLDVTGGLDSVTAVDAASGGWLRFEWDPAVLPGLAVDPGCLPVPMPATASGPSLAQAAVPPTVEPGQSAAWWLRATVGGG